MSRIVIECGLLGYYLVTGEIERNEFPLKNLIQKFSIDGTGYFYFEDEGLEINESEILKNLMTLAHINHGEKIPKLNRIN
ncbi:hypothetical protein [Acinetobacter sp. ULE_I037]|uniref:hypothetical protein n=1 Tax=unclassified Acinetobacter TaxID=196816 RepID=UPI003AF7F515